MPKKRKNSKKGSMFDRVFDFKMHNPLDYKKDLSMSLCFDSLYRAIFESDMKPIDKDITINLKENEIKDEKTIAKILVDTRNVSISIFMIFINIIKKHYVFYDKDGKWRNHVEIPKKMMQMRAKKFPKANGGDFINNIMSCIDFLYTKNHVQWVKSLPYIEEVFTHSIGIGLMYGLVNDLYKKKYIYFTTNQSEYHCLYEGNEELRIHFNLNKREIESDYESAIRYFKKFFVVLKKTSNINFYNPKPDSLQFLIYLFSKKSLQIVPKKGYLRFGTLKHYNEIFLEDMWSSKLTENFYFKIKKLGNMEERLKKAIIKYENARSDIFKESKRRQKRRKRPEKEEDGDPKEKGEGEPQKKKRKIE